MQILRKKYRQLIVLPILLVFAAVPFLDSMACDDFDRSAPFPGSGFEIKCKDFLKINKTSSGSKAESEGQRSPGGNVHVFCPICFSVAEMVSFYNPDVFFLRALFRPQLFQISLAEFATPIDKPPQN